MPAAVVTNPVAKSVLYKAGFADPGPHRISRAAFASRPTGDPAWPVMMLWAPEVAVVPVTIHIPFKDVPQQLTRDLIFETGRVVARDLVEPLRHRAPASCGRRPQSARRRGRHARQGGQPDRAARDRAADRRRHRRARPASRRHHVPRGGAQDLRRRALHVSRPGADPDQDARLRSRASTSRSACRSCAPRPITAPPSTSPAPARPIRRA